MSKQLKEIYNASNVVNFDNKSVFYYFTEENGLTAELQNLLAVDTTSELYYLNRQDKTLSPIFHLLLDVNNTSLNLTSEELAKMIIKRCAEGWKKLYSSLYADYNPINNYDMIEEENSEANTKNTVTSDTTSKYAGFNSNENNLPIQNETSGTSDSIGLEDDNNTHRRLTRSGNIGVTTSQQMIESEIKLRNQKLLDIIFIDIDKILFIDYYK